MALVHRINSNFGFVLNTLYCKSIINIKRFVTEHNVVGCSDKTGTNKLKDYKPFNEILQFRQNEAKKSILIRLYDMRCISDLESFCKSYATIVNIFPYRTSNENNFVLMELNSAEDVKKFQNIAISKANTEYAQGVTPLFSFKSRNKLHLNKSEHDIRTYPNFQAPKPNDIKKLLEEVDSVSDQMISLYNISKITDLDIRLRFYTADQISYYLSRLFTNIDVVPFGSSVNGFGQVGCDLDLLCKIVTNTDQNFNLKKLVFISQDISLAERNEQKEFLDIIGTTMKIFIPGITNVKKILEARVPIIKFYNINTNMKCDLSGTNTVALQMSELLYVYGQLDWRIRPLVCTIRKWARAMDLTKEYPGQWITNFSLTLLIIFYLQRKDILPSVNTINCFVELSRNNKKVVDPNFNWFISWVRSIKRINNESLRDLLFNFFEYYSTFDFKTQAICIRDGRYKPKNDFSPLYIHNPFNTALNVSKNVNINELMRLVNSFQKAFNMMLDSDERDTLCKLINLGPRTKTNYSFNNQKTEIGLEEKLLPTVTNINGLEEMQRNIIK
ncbi:poly(A) RNA polymerase, mitochondrial isoform X1 [Bombus pascuorum]|uniref:poly(A) RNA polymerase, mitochondrial isoform X1 n=1 Tax=Bombus pascuorum TaxID=65598 RepID=UPI0021311746|nr:poly(A) RNA polymerase, mitochondrial isoform X1 [Bombus pascuorum]